ncbi:MAG TPA: DUF4363 family protein [Clostridiales bacterium]|nr:DUF4363 family protein [Clostridiales bacterium]
MRIVAIMLVIILAFFAMSIFVQIQMKKTAEQLLGKLDTVEDCIEKGEWTLGRQHMEELKASWTRVRKKWEIIHNHKEIDDIDVTVVKVDRFIKMREKPSAMAEIAALRLYISHIPEKEAFRLSNLL